MIISHQYRCIFIKTIKTAGTSIEVFLSGQGGDEDVFTPIHPPVAGHQPRNHGNFYNHFPAWGVRQRVPAAIWDNYFKFCVERNPWDKTISHYNMVNQRNGGGYTLQDYLDRRQFCRSWALYTDDDDTVLVDRVLRFERLDDELGAVCAQLGIPWTGSLEVHAKADYRQDRRPYREWYTPAQAATVARVFADEIREFGYVF